MKAIKQMTVGALAVAGAWCAMADMVSYLDPVFDAEGATSGYVSKSADCTKLAVASETLLLNSGWYCVEALSAVLETIVIVGDVHLILKDGANLMVNAEKNSRGGLRVEGSSSLTVYAQSTDGDTMGKIYAYGGSNAAAIGSGSDDKVACGKITINGGNITATGGNDAAGIGGGDRGQAANGITINGGTVTATGGDCGAGIGGGRRGSGENITINGGTVTATGGKDGGAGIGGGGYAGESETGYGKNITINGGLVTANGCEGGAGIGGAEGCNGDAITIRGGRVTALGAASEDTDYACAAGIGGGGRHYNTGPGSSTGITISGGTVRAYASVGSCPGLGGGTSWQYGIMRATQNVVISGGSVDARNWIDCMVVNAAGVEVLQSCVIGVSNSPVRVSFPDYGDKDLYPDDDGCLYPFLPGLALFEKQSFFVGRQKCEGDIVFETLPGTYCGVTVNGVDVGEGVGEGWRLSGDILTLDKAMDYKLSGTGKASGIRVQVTANATVTLDNLSLPLFEDVPCMAFASGATDAKLVLKGTNKVYSQNGYPAVDIQPGAKVTLSGDGALVGGKAAGVNSRGVYNNGIFVMDGGTIRDYCMSADGGAVYNNGGTFTMNGGTVSGCQALNGGALYNKGTAAIYGGTIRDNRTEVNGGFCYCYDGCSTYIYGGFFSGNTAPEKQKSNLYHGYGRQHNGRLYGGVFAADPTSLAESGDAGTGCCLELQGGAKVTQAADKWIVGKDVEQRNQQLTGGTYTFNPMNAEYAAAGVTVMDNCLVSAQGTTPETYLVHRPVEFLINGSSLSAGGGVGWSFDDETGLLSLTNAMDYALSGSCERSIKVDVTANAQVALTDVTIPADNLGRAVFNVTASDVRFSLGGTNEIYTTDGHAAIGVGSGAKLTVDGDGALVGGKTANATCLGVSVNGGTFVMNGGTISGYKGGSYGGGIYFANGMGELNAGAITDCSATYGGALVLWNSGTVNIQSGMAICGNSAVSHGAVFLQGGTINVWGGTFTDNTVSSGVLVGLSGALNVYGGVFVGKSVAPVYRSTVYGGVYDVIPEGVVSGYACKEVGTEEGSNYVVGKDIKLNGEDQLIEGTYTFCPTNAQYEAAELYVEPGTLVTKKATTPVTWVLGVVYPGYMEGKSEAVKAKFKAWAKAYPPGDPDGIYANAFLLNVAQSREAEAVAAFKIGSVAVTNEVVGTVTNTLVVVESAQPLAPATMFNGDTWLQCATNGLGEADFLDIEGGRYTEEVKSFFIQRIDFEHTLTPEAFPTEPTGGKTMRLIVK